MDEREVVRMAVGEVPGVCSVSLSSSVGVRPAREDVGGPGRPTDQGKLTSISLSISIQLVISWFNLGHLPP